MRAHAGAPPVTARIAQVVPCAAGCGIELRVMQSHTANDSDGGLAYFHPECCAVCPHDRPAA